MPANGQPYTSFDQLPPDMQKSVLMQGKRRYSNITPEQIMQDGALAEQLMRAAGIAMPEQSDGENMRAGFDYITRQMSPNGGQNEQSVEPTAKKGVGRAEAAAPMPPRRPASVDKQAVPEVDMTDPAMYAEGMPSGPVHTVQLPNAQQVAIASGQQAPEQRTPIMDGFRGVIASVVQTLGQRNAANASTSPSQSSPVAVKGPMMTPEMLEEQIAMAEGSEDALQQQRYGAKVEALNPVSRSMQKGIDEKAAKRGDKPPPANASWAEQLRYNLRNTVGGGKKQDAKPSAR